MAQPPKALPNAASAVSTINDVARLAGVSIKTVSRVMNDEPNVRDETRAKVKEAANLLHYRPNLLARSLAGARSFMIGLLYDNPSQSYVYDLQMGAIRRCRQSGYHVMAEPQDAHAPDLERAIGGLLATIRLDGVILTPPLCDMAVVLQTIEAAGVPYVRVAPFLYPGRSAAVRMDDAKAAFDMTRHLLDLGHRDIGFILGHPEHGASHLRYEGYVKAMRDAGMEPRAEWVKQGYFSFESGIDAARSLFAGAERPTAVFASNDSMAFGMIAHCHQTGIRVPDDVSVVGFDDTPGALLVWPHLTTIRQPIEDLAHQAADMLLARANGEDAGHPGDTRLLPFELIPRQSAQKL
ncbi:transcriptional regulator [Asticcacaulis sp. AC460]|uniref:LacI family DNA-binding transcriptional regulator n=1 Tax=Asticcacaulis sp. AC460 TaxID=1282360 RepID=UPI0003C4049B|nr:LacI family DNA-binding transcriptional regulator [Asticcacaulis sp. AC460]ESQ88621.1 transcriptional regulator [Asticcacaulis sp. AC460]